MQYQVCADDPDAFTLDGTYDDPDFKTGGDSSCVDDYIGIEGTKA